MNDSVTTLAEIREHIQAFSRRRGWCEGENAKDLAMALSVESAELLEIFQWLHSDRADSVRNDPAQYEHLREELADIFWYTMRICAHFDVDLARAVLDKSQKNAEKYPE